DRVLGPLVRATVDNALASGENALTGPVARGDVATVEAHVAALRELAGGAAATGPDTGPQLLTGYLALGRQTAERARASGRLDETTYRAVLTALEEGERP
ncbi:MAG: DUF2520 domain-containing protein, partial [Kocuria rhizophila]|nr:DUF2520 domain-containing protein [Kocuria rhizophila]